MKERLSLRIRKTKSAGMLNIHTLATNFITAPTGPPANGPIIATIGSVIAEQIIAAVNPSRIQQITQGTATKSIRIDHGVANRGGKASIIIERAAKTIISVILTDGFFNCNVSDVIVSKPGIKPMLREDVINIA